MLIDKGVDEDGNIIATSLEPTHSPSDGPTLDPTNVPTLQPTNTPSLFPTATIPSKSPIAEVTATYTADLNAIIVSPLILDSVSSDCAIHFPSHAHLFGSAICSVQTDANMIRSNT